LYQTVAQENIENLNRYGVRKVITHCPHCFNTIKNEFPQFGGTYEVVHHSVLIQELIASGRIKPKKTLDATVVFHDSCYLGRYNGIMDAPRDVARAVPGLRVIDPPRTRERGLCCGGGGGHMWMEVKSEKRVNVIRVEELLATRANVVGTACPFCLAMVDLGRKVKEAEETLAVELAHVLDRQRLLRLSVLPGHGGPRAKGEGGRGDAGGQGRERARRRESGVK